MVFVIESDIAKYEGKGGIINSTEGKIIANFFILRPLT